jgi:amidohydrolase
MEVPEDQVIDWRRHLHRHPEPSFQERETAAFVAQTLEGFDGLEIERPTENSVLARLATGRPGRTVALRADIDALPITRRAASSSPPRPGAMHACGPRRAHRDAARRRQALGGADLPAARSASSSSTPRSSPRAARATSSRPA